MAPILTRKALGHFSSIRSTFLGCLSASPSQRKNLISNSGVGFCLGRTFITFWVPDEVFSRHRCFCSQGLSWEAASNEVLMKRLESALKDHKVDEAWARFKDFKSLYGFPNHAVLNRFITELAYSSKPQWLQKACDLVSTISEREPDLLHHDVLTKLLLSLARALMPEPASTMLRLMLEKEIMPSVDVLRTAFLHLVKSEPGACLASNFLLQLCDRYLRLTFEKGYHCSILKPDTMMFNLVLGACLRFSMSIKGQELVEMMARAGVVADAHTIVLISGINERNGQCNDLRMFKEHIDRLPCQYVAHYRQFYDSLLSLHFKFDDIDSAEKLVLDMCKSREAHCIQRIIQNPQKPRLISLGSDHIRSGLKLRIAPQLLQKDSPLGDELETELVLIRDGQLFPTNTALAKLIHGYKRHGKTDNLSNLLLGIRKELHSSGGTSLPADVVDACISLGWLELAHDILDDFESAGSPLDSLRYKTLLIGYQSRGMSRDAEALLKKMWKIGVITTPSDDEAMASRWEEAEPNTIRSNLAECLARELGEEDRTTRKLHELNSSVYYFSKARMVGDALTAYRKMQEMRIAPSVQTFSYMIEMYSSLCMYREITILWGDLKRKMAGGKLGADRDLLELLVMNFLKGGYFERVMEVIAYMNQHRVYADRGMYRSEFLRLHNKLYRSLKASNARTEAQRKRLEHVKTFRRWAGID